MSLKQVESIDVVGKWKARKVSKLAFKVAQQETGSHRTRIGPALLVSSFALPRASSLALGLRLIGPSGLVCIPGLSANVLSQTAVVSEQTPCTASSLGHVRLSGGEPRRPPLEGTGALRVGAHVLQLLAGSLWRTPLQNAKLNASSSQ